MSEIKEIQNRYIERQDNCDLKIGQMVKVIRAAKSYERGWSESWGSPMDQWIGQIKEITEITNYGITLEKEYNFPYFVLEPAFKSDKVLKCPMCGKIMCVMDKMEDNIHVSSNPNVFEDAITFEYNCSNPECGMSMYYPFKVSEVPNGEDYFERKSQKSEKSENISDLSFEDQMALEQKE